MSRRRKSDDGHPGRWNSLELKKSAARLETGEIGHQLEFKREGEKEQEQHRSTDFIAGQA